MKEFSSPAGRTQVIMPGINSAVPIFPRVTIVHIYPSSLNILTGSTLINSTNLTLWSIIPVEFLHLDPVAFQ
jgi:hypothetical protein